MFVPTVLLEERARTFQDALDKLYEDQSAAEYVEYFKALELLLANYHTTIRIPAVAAAAPLPSGRNTVFGCWQSQSLRNKSRCLSVN